MFDGCCASLRTDELELLRFIDQLAYDCQYRIVFAGFTQKEISPGLKSTLSVRLINACGPKENRSLPVKLPQFLTKLNSGPVAEFAGDHVQIAIDGTSDP